MTAHNLLLITGGRHPYAETTPVIEKCLRAAGHAVTLSHTASELAEPGLDRFAAIVFNSCRGGANDGRYAIPPEELDNDFSPAQRAGFQAYVAGGGGLVALHVAPTSCPGWPEFRKIAGGGWIWGQSWHPPFGRFPLSIADRTHPVTSGVQDFETDDELYCDLEVPADARIFLAATHDGIQRPMGWSIRYGAGRVVNLSLGHAGASVENAGFQALLRNAVLHVANVDALMQFADILLPGDADFPSATNSGMAATLRSRLGDATAQRLLAAIGGPPVHPATVARIEANEPALFEEILKTVYLTYYEQEPVVAAIRTLGMPYNWAPLPEGYAPATFDAATDAPKHGRGRWTPTDHVTPIGTPS